MIWFSRYEGIAKSLCRGMKDGDGECCRSAAFIFSAMLPSGATICPMPSHMGIPTYMAKVCDEVKKIRPDIKVWSGLRFIPYDSSYGLKKLGLMPDAPTVYNCEQIPYKNIYVLDNVIATGRTARAVENVGFIVMAIARDGRRV